MAALSGLIKIARLNGPRSWTLAEIAESAAVCPYGDFIPAELAALAQLSADFPPPLDGGIDNAPR